jgi:pentapeptide MXKDX repeat protein
MAIRTRIASGISAAAVSLGLALTPAAFAQDAMQQDIDFKNALSQGHVVQAPADQQRHRVQGRQDKATRHLQARQEARR